HQHFTAVPQMEEQNAKKASRPKKDGPSFPKLIVAAVVESKKRKGVSLAAIKKSNKRINTALTKLVTKGVLTQTKGTGASGSFKLAKKEPKVSKPVKKVAKKKAPIKKAAPKKAVKKTPKKSPKKPKAVVKKPKAAVKKPKAKKAANK
uniref:H15 domain-containing protein n=1 Tax=Acanthochromis polyacanthus TaxID=80966 RepID=A0A3Q1GQL2_9TELE